MNLRPDLKIPSQWINDNSHVLDLGCGDGSLLKYLHDKSNVSGYGIEINHSNIVECIKKGVNVIQNDLDAGLSVFEDDTFDYVLLTQTLQAIWNPDKLIEDMLRVGREAIITFPNFGHWKSRINLAFGGRMPVTRSLPHRWYSTPNIHLCTIRDFEKLCQHMKISVVKRTVVNAAHKQTLATRWFPNLLGEIALYHIRRS
ncbi:Methionine biosynthesis protein MetW [hydrothermal vent metagenome]|uniref:Methionine biosynthesis protein MetW n=1 Tax=hydrothermal vent metagenome TaxID=652676 RepID=A0A3B0Y792_9ZZZZ